MQQLTCKMVWCFSFILFLKGLNFKKSLGGNNLKSVEKCEKCEKVPKRLCPLVVAL